MRYHIAKIFQFEIDCRLNFEVWCLLQKLKGVAQSTRKIYMLEAPILWQSARNYLLDYLDCHAVLHTATRIQELGLPQNLQPKEEQLQHTTSTTLPEMQGGEHSKKSTHIPRTLWRRRGCWCGWGACCRWSPLDLCGASSGRSHERASPVGTMEACSHSCGGGGSRLSGIRRRLLLPPSQPPWQSLRERAKQRGATQRTVILG
jgi:hypothetical protein